MEQKAGLEEVLNPRVTDDEWGRLCEQFDTQWLLNAVDQADILLASLNDGERLQPLQIRADLLQLHQLAMAVVNEGSRDRAIELFDRADDLDLQVSDMMMALEKIQRTLIKLVELRPESLDEAETSK